MHASLRRIRIPSEEKKRRGRLVTYGANGQIDPRELS